MKKITTATERRTGRVQEQHLTIGLDVGDRSSFYCVLNGAGEVNLQAKVASRPEALKEAFGRMPRSRIALETGTHSPWMSRLLSELGHEAIVAHARDVRLTGESRRKDDKIDAQTLARLARIDHPAKDGVSVSIKDVVRDGSALYVRFAVTNSSTLPYRIEPPNVFEIAPRQSADLLPSMKGEQIAAKTLAQFGANKTTQVPVRETDIPQKDLSPGATAEGVVEVRPEDAAKPGIYEFDFGADGDHAVKATAVL